MVESLHIKPRKDKELDGIPRPRKK